jgi:hypothetical protein
MAVTAADQHQLSGDREIVHNSLSVQSSGAQVNTKKISHI